MAMHPTPARRRRFASLMLGTWVFALFVGIANACLPGEGPQGHSAMHATAAAYHDADESVPPDCAQFCNEDLPLVAKLKTVHDQSAVQPLLVALFEVPVVAERSLRVDPALLAHPPPGVPVYLRSLRLAL